MQNIKLPEILPELILSASNNTRRKYAVIARRNTFVSLMFLMNH